MDHVDEWNAKHPTGTRVLYFPTAGSFSHMRTTTRSYAWRLASGDPLVKVEGVVGGVSLEHVVPEVEA